MSRFKRIVCLYLSAALILGAVITGFGTENIALFGINKNVEISKEAETETAPLSESICTEVPVVTEPTTEEFTTEATTTQAVTEEITTEAVITETATEIITTEAVTEFTTDETTTEAVTEVITSEAATEAATEAITTEATTEPTTEAELPTDDDIITFEEILEVKPELHKSDYSPAKSNEKVSELSFLSETKDSLSSADTANVYTFSVDKKSMFSYKFSHPAPTGMEGWEVSLYSEYSVNGDGKNKDYRLINTLKTTTQKSDKSPEIGLAPGEYRLVVKKGAAFSSATYKIEATLKKTSEYEIECNDNIYRYTEIYSGVPVKGSASSFPDRQDEDYYLLRMYEDGFIDLKFEHATIKDKISVCWQVLLFSEDGTCVFSVNSIFTDTVNKSGKIGLQKGNYYVLVRNRVYTDMTYTLTLSRTDNKDYESEKNDTIDKANQIGVGSTVSGSLASQINGIDRDYFKFSLDTNGWCVIDFAHEPIEDLNEKDDSDYKNGWNITLLDEKGNMIYKGISAWADDVTASSMIGLAKGTYYIKIDSENLYLNSEKYYLTVNFTENADCETEFNNTFNESDALNVQIPVSGFLSERETDYDVDFYILEITEKSDIKIEFSHEKLPSSRDIFNFTLYNFKRQKIKSTDKNGNEGPTLIKSLSDKEKTVAYYKDLPAGKYYVKVTPGIFFSDIQYTLSFTQGE